MDPSGSPITAAKVLVVAEDTNVQIETTTNPSGEYTVPYLQPGLYNVTASMEGFSSSRTSGTRLGTNETVRVDLSLALGAILTVVEVTANPTALQTENATVQNTVGEVVIDSVPNITSNPLFYATLQPGVSQGHNLNTSQTARAFGIGQESRRQFTEISINGGQAFTNELLLDGISIQGPNRHEATVVPNPEGLQEVRTLVNNYSAEYGRGQGVITLTTKSGTNEYHGSLFYRLRNEALNANSFGNNARRITRQPFKVSQYGATFGGPIAKDKTFFFASYEGLQHTSSEDFYGTVPTESERRGDFSQSLVNVSGVPRQLRLFDPFGATQVGPNRYQRPEIQNAIIPNPDPFALHWLSFYPKSNRTPDDTYNNNNFFNRSSRTFDRNSVNARVDQYWGKNSLYGTLGAYHGDNIGDPTWGAGSVFQGGQTVASGGLGLLVTDRNYYAAIGNTFVASPTLVVDARYGISRVNSVDGLPTVENFDYNQFGIPADLQAINPTPGLAPKTVWEGRWSQLQGDTTQRIQHQLTHHLQSSVTKTANRWTFKLGGEYRVYLTNQGRNGPLAVRSSNTHTREFVDSAGAGVGSVTADVAGDGAAAFLLGAGDLWITADEGDLQHALAHKYVGFYSQNDWQVTPRLKMNLGVRWDIQPGITERYDRACGIDLGQTNPFGTQGRWACAGRDGYSRNFWDAQYTDFAPRLGLTYRFTDTFVLRTGYSLTYLAGNTGFGNTGFGYGVDMFQNVVETTPFGDNPAGVIVGKFNEVHKIIPPIGYDPANPLMYGGMESTFARGGDQINPRVQQWNLFLEKRVGDTVLVAGYSASKGSHLWVSRFPAQNEQSLPQSLLDSWRQSYIQNNGTNNPGTEQIPNPYQPVGGPLLPFPSSLGRATLSRVNANMPYPHFLRPGAAFTALSQTIGWSNYHSLVLQAKRALSNGLLLDAHYTWSKSLDFSQSELNSGAQLVNGAILGNPLSQRNLRDNYAPSLFDRTHQATLLFVYDLPFGAGKRFEIGNSVLRGILGNWRVGGVARLSSGTPIEITGASTGAMNGRPDRASGAATEVPKDLQRWYDGKTTVTLPSGRQITPCNFCFLKYSSDAFQGRVVQTPNGSLQPDVYWLGNAALRYSDIRSPGVSRFDLSVDKTFRPREAMELSLSAEITNALNTVSFRPNINRNLGATNTRNVPAQGLQSGQGQSSDFGTHGTDSFDPRQVQLQLKLRF